MNIHLNTERLNIKPISKLNIEDVYKLHSLEETAKFNTSKLFFLLLYLSSFMVNINYSQNIIDANPNKCEKIQKLNQGNLLYVYKLISTDKIKRIKIINKFILNKFKQKNGINLEKKYKINNYEYYLFFNEYLDTNYGTPIHPLFIFNTLNNDLYFFDIDSLVMKKNNFITYKYVRDKLFFSKYTFKKNELVLINEGKIY